MTDLILDGGVRASIEVIERRSTWPDSFGQGTAAISISRAITAALWRPGSYTLFAQTAPRRRSEGSDGRPERPVAELNDGPRVAVRRPWYRAAMDQPPDRRV